GLHVLAIHVHHRHLQPGNAHVEGGGTRRGVDKPQTHFFTWFKQSVPVGCRTVPVHQIGIGGAGDIQQIGGAHAHLAPRKIIFRSVPKAVFLHITQEFTHITALVIIIAFHLNIIFEHLIGILEGKVREYHGVFAVVLYRIVARGVPTQRPVVDELFLQAWVAVVPVGAVLTGRVAVLKRLSGDYAVKADARTAVHLEGRQNTVPVDGGIFIQLIFHPNEHLLAFLH